MPDVEARSAFPAILKSYMDQFRMNQSDIAKHLDISKQTVSDWITGKKFPGVNNMQALANLFGVYMSEMYTPTGSDAVFSERLSVPSFSISDDEKRLVKLYRGADDRAKADALRVLSDHQLNNTLSNTEK